MILLFLFLQLCGIAFATLWIRPEQVHISLGEDSRSMIVTWVTLEPVKTAFNVYYGDDKSRMSERVPAETLPLFDKENCHFYTYRALLTRLRPSTTYYFQLQHDDHYYSKTYEFRTVQDGPEYLPRLAIYGDLGWDNHQSLPYLTKDVVERNLYDVIFHIGDFAYNLHTDNCTVGHNFMNSIEKIASRVPYMVIPGNHDAHNSYAHYDYRFSMLGDRHNSNPLLPLSQRINNYYHSFDIGPAHIVMFNTEFYYFNTDFQSARVQFEWLEEDLKRANANRAQRPWIIAMGHRPMYCFRFGEKSCNYLDFERANLRQGVPLKNRAGLHYGLEELFYKNGVDLEFYGHEHAFARMLPVHNFTAMFENRTTAYVNPKAPILIVTGSAGNIEQHIPFNPKVDQLSFLGFRAYDYGYTRLHFKDRNEIVLEQVSDDKNGTIIDTVSITKKADLPVWLLEDYETL